MEDKTDKKEISEGVGESPKLSEPGGDADVPKVPLADEPVVIPANLKLRLDKCPKCLYERQSGDDKFASPFECPKCGVVYALAMEEIRRKGRGQELQDEAEAEEMRRLAQVQDENIRSSQIGSAMFVGEERNKIWIAVILVALAALGAYLYLFQ
jgi:DNA-directed RNA polymerase subunit M/transcription elongation factor TFIIS